MSVVLALLSSVLWGGADFYGGVMSKRRPVYAVVGGSQACGLIAVTLVVLAADGFSSDRGWIGWSIAAGLAGASGLLCFYAALASGTMGVISPIAALGVAVPLVVGFARGEEPSGLALAGIAVGVLGAVAASGPELTSAVGLRPVLLAAVSGVLFGACFTFLALGAESSALMTLWGMRVTSVAGFVVAALVVRSMGGLRSADVPGLLAIGLGDAGANLLFALASQRGLLSVTSVAGSLYPVTTVLLAYVVLRERLRPIQVAGVAAALFGVALMSLG